MYSARWNALLAGTAVALALTLSSYPAAAEGMSEAEISAAQRSGVGPPRNQCGTDVGGYEISPSSSRPTPLLLTPVS